MYSHMHVVHWQWVSQSFFGFSSFNRIHGPWEDVIEFRKVRKYVVAITWSTYSSHIVGNATGVFFSWAIRLNWTFTTMHFPHIEYRWPMLQSSSHDIAPNATVEHISQSWASRAAPSGEFTMKYAVTLNTREIIVMRGAQYLKSIRTRCNRIKSENWTGFSLLRSINNWNSYKRQHRFGIGRRKVSSQWHIAFRSCANFLTGYFDCCEKSKDRIRETES